MHILIYVHYETLKFEVLSVWLILSGEYASAIETLVTAISLIKQSKVAHDDRCKILTSSLQVSYIEDEATELYCI